MKWAKYSGLLLLFFCLFFGLSPLRQVNAANISLSSLFNSWDNVIFIIDQPSSLKQWRVKVWCTDYRNTLTWSSTYNYYRSTDGLNYNKTYYSYNDAIGQLSSSSLDYDGSSTGITLTNTVISIALKGSVVFNGGSFNNYYSSLEDYLDSIEPSWWENVKSAFMDFVSSDALSYVLSGDWISYIEDVLFGELWTVKVGEGEDDLIVPETVSATPSPSPTPLPTPIPYSTVIDPGTGEIHYHYTINVSGTPVPTSSIYPPVTSAPPGPGSGSTIDEPVAIEDYYEPEDSLSVPKLRIFKFLLRMTGNDVDVGMDSLDNNMAVMDATLEDNAEAISGVGDLFQLIPVKWFLLIGTLACFPVIAAMIKSLLGG